MSKFVLQVNESEQARRVFKHFNLGAIGVAIHIL